MVILGAGGWGWALVGFGEFGLGRLVWGVDGARVGLWVCGWDCGLLGRKRGFMWVVLDGWRGFGGWL